MTVECGFSCTCSIGARFLSDSERLLGVVPGGRSSVFDDGMGFVVSGVSSNYESVTVLHGELRDLLKGLAKACVHVDDYSRQEVQALRRLLASVGEAFDCFWEAR